MMLAIIAGLVMFLSNMLVDGVNLPLNMTMVFIGTTAMFIINDKIGDTTFINGINYNLTSGKDEIFEEVEDKKEILEIAEQIITEVNYLSFRNIKEMGADIKLHNRKMNREVLSSIFNLSLGYLLSMVIFKFSNNLGFNKFLFNLFTSGLLTSIIVIISKENISEIVSHISKSYIILYTPVMFMGAFSYYVYPKTIYGIVSMLLGVILSNLIIEIGLYSSK